MEGCQNCYYPGLFKVFSDILYEDYVPGAVRVNEHIDEIDGKCFVCNEILHDDDYIIDDKDVFLEESLKYLANEISKEIYECQYCNWTIIPYVQQYEDPLTLKIISELVDEYFIPSDLQLKIYELLRCDCGNHVTQDDPYVSKEEMNEWFNNEVEFIVETFNISGDETDDFIQYLQENPMLGLAHPVGVKIFNKVNHELQGTEKVEGGSKYYRARARNKYQRLVPFIEEELWNPPIGIPQQGRYNPPGVTNLYLGECKDTILMEISPSKLDIVDVAEFIVTRDLKVFNSTKTDIDIFTGMLKEPNGFSNSYEYIFPNFLAQCLSYHGYDGIIYASVKNSSALNLCLFNVKRNEDIRMNAIFTNTNFSSEKDLFGIEPKQETIVIENTKSKDLTLPF
ncbi:hypothetical protein CSV80_13390 [Sporosarcina sp. P12(2017)]|uniref:RES family NAD+ phosphorylase n=1 Tax=unclassified Sporosarcina TaxID=2647733 RepID=UPI000C16DACE|nr:MULTISPECIES: RES family NAD+ phosphorylase [unclassified Sporosarcina]PIC56664.1 hypothetical protein CSV81_12825 [Sporosarcina sp. P10]PIC59881.1 hypothetical protein CSV80_13390 [Sporosarcina sp. P12(2017)]